MSSKPAEPADKEAVQRTARIDKSLKNDKKVMDRTIKILLLGTFLDNSPYLSQAVKYSHPLKQVLVNPESPRSLNRCASSTLVGFQRTSVAKRVR